MYDLTASKALVRTWSGLVKPEAAKILIFIYILLFFFGQTNINQVISEINGCRPVL